MKKVLLSLAAVFAFGFTNAQEMKFGVKGAVGITSFSGMENAKSGIGFQIGGFAEIGIADKMFFQPELLFSSASAKSSYSEEVPGFYSLTATSKSSLSHIAIPLMFKYQVAEKIGLETGPQIGFLMSTKTTVDVSETAFGTTTSESTSSTDKTNSNKTAFAWNIGAGYDVTENFNIGLRYSVGLSKVQKELAANEKAIKANALLLNLSYKF